MNTLFVFSSSRQIRKYHEKVCLENALLDKALSVREFFSKVLQSPKRKASEYESLLLMQKACSQTKNIHKLHIAPSFFAFLKNKEYLFSFFKELIASQKSIKDLQDNDYYAQYNEHLELLQNVLQNYCQLLNEANLCDELSLMLSYELNVKFLKNYEKIVFDLQGFLNNFEMTLLSQISKYSELILRFSVSKFNLSHLQSLAFLKNLRLQIGFEYELNLSSMTLIKERQIISKKAQISFQSFELASLQAAFVFEKISLFLQQGLRADEIVLITPNESFTELLRLYDSGKMLNYASGKSLKESFLYQKLRTLYKSASDEDFAYKQTKDYFKDEQNSFDLHNSLLHLFELEFEEFQKEFRAKSANWQYFENLVRSLLENEESEMKALINDELLFLKSLFKAHSLSLKELLELFFMKLNQLQLSAVGGGEVTAMGLLESRGLEFRGVIIVDFNDDIIPKRDINELFLNNEIRKKAGLISYEQRENLQRLYYERLIQNADFVAISCVENEEKFPSRLLDDLGINSPKIKPYTHKAYAKALAKSEFLSQIDLTPTPPPKQIHNIFEKPLSFTRLDTFLNHKRKYYYKYILGVKEPRVLGLEKNPLQLGAILHELLEQTYKLHHLRFDLNFFKNELKKSGLNRLDTLLWTLKFEDFAKKEQEHFAKGFFVKELEKECETKYALKDFTITLEGKIDRIDEDREKNTIIIDYKSGKKLPEKSFQLAFYKALYDKNAKALYYNLQTMNLESSKEKSLEELEETLISLYEQRNEAIEFENEKDDPHCPYQSIYKKDFK